MWFYFKLSYGMKYVIMTHIMILKTPIWIHVLPLLKESLDLGYKGKKSSAIDFLRKK
jgi:hypothetical protein